MKTLDDLLAEGVSGRRVLVRADLNVPLDGDTHHRRRPHPGVAADHPPADRGRRARGGHRAPRPAEGRAGPEVLAAARSPRGSASCSARTSPLADDLVGPSAKSTVDGLADGGVALLENVRFDPRETSKDDAERGELAGELAALVGESGVFVSDGFGVVHRKQASVFDVARVLPGYAGGLVLAELEVLRRLTGTPDRPYVVVLGGSKVSDKLAVIESLLPKVDRLLVGGGMCFTFMAAEGLGVGDSLLEADMIDTCKRLLAEAGDKIVLPADVVIADEFSADADTHTVLAAQMREGWKGLDIGPITAERYGEVLRRGGHGVLERPDGRVRAGAVRRGHPRRSRSPSWTRRRSAWSAAATPRPRCARSACPRTASRTSPPAAARRWSSWRARSFRASRYLEQP